MCNIEIKQNIEQELKREGIDNFFIDYFGNNWISEKINGCGWWLQENNLLYCNNNSEKIKDFVDSRLPEIKEIKKIFINMGYKYEYAINKTLLYLKSPLTT
jgi:hypothetical protein